MRARFANVASSKNGGGTELTIYTADLKWTASEGEDFLKGRFSRAHTLSFDGGTVVPASASPHVVGKWAVEAAVDPEEMLVAALSSCHMLSFLHVARLAGFAVAAYDDHAEGLLEEIVPGRQAVSANRVGGRRSGQGGARAPARGRLMGLTGKRRRAATITTPYGLSAVSG